MLILTKKNIDDNKLDLEKKSSFWQSVERINIILKSGQAEKIFVLNNNLVVEKRRVALWEYWLFILWINSNFEINEKQLIALVKQEKALFIQVEYISYNENFEQIKLEKFSEEYYKKFITPYTAIINLENTEDEILVNMKPKWRYNIKLAKKKLIEVKEVEKTDENIKIYYDLMLETTSRDNFFGNNFDYYKTFLQENKNAYLLLAYKDEKAIAWWIFVDSWDTSIYYYWASTSDKKYRNLMAPYLVQWTAIEKSKASWKKIYDFLWIATPDEKNSDLAWVTDFKLKLTKNKVNVSKSFIYKNKKCKYFVIKMLKKLKK